MAMDRFAFLVSLLSYVSVIYCYNISWNTSQVTLPYPIYNPICHFDTQTNRLIIIGGFNSKNKTIIGINTADLSLTDLMSTNSNNNNNSVLYSFTNLEDSIPQTKSIHCKAEIKCYSITQDFIYIIRSTKPQLRFIAINYTNNVNNNYIAYDLSDSIYEIYPDDISDDNMIKEYGYLHGCVISTDSSIISLGSDADAITSGLTYDILSNKWRKTKYHLFTQRYGIGCGMDILQEYIYIFGGEYGASSQIRMINQWDYKQGILSWEVIPTELLTGRSFHSVVVNSNNYFFIYGGFTNGREHNLNIEIFDAETKQMLNYMEYVIEQLTVFEFGSVFIDDILYIIGGKSITDEVVTDQISYFDTNDINKYVELPLDNYYCRTVYSPNNSYTDIDNYLYRYLDTLLFDIRGPHPSFYLRFDPVNSEACEIIITRESNGLIKWEFISKQAKQDQTASGNMSYTNTSYWLTWSLKEDSGTFTPSYPFWRIGAGHNVDENDFGIIQTNADYWRFYVASMAWIQIKSKLNNKWIFYSKSCSVSITLSAPRGGNRFWIGDYISIDIDLMKADSLDGYIDIYSSDFEYFHYKVLLETGNICKLCDVNTDSKCVYCNKGILISDLVSYDIYNNEYIIAITSDQPLPITPKRFVFIRNVMEIDVNITYNDDDGFTIGTLLNIYIDYDKTKVPQPNGRVIIDFIDIFFTESFELIIDFKEDTCILLATYNETVNNTVSEVYNDNDVLIANGSYCGSIRISNMKYKIITNNIYRIKLISKDIIVNPTEIILNRKIQKMNITLPKSVYLGENIMINYTDDINNVQPSSIINIYSFDLNLDYSMLRNYSMLCTLTNERGSIHEQTVCANGIAFSGDNINVGDRFTIYITSLDTEILSSSISILTIDECPIGEGLDTQHGENECEECITNTVNIKRNSQCMECNTTGVQCNGKNELIISKNYWINIEHKNHTESSMFVGKCPSSFCCTLSDGCDYMKQQDSLCAQGRDSSIPLCGACLDGYSEIIGMTQCAECFGSRYYILIYPFVIASIFVFILMITDGVKQISSSKRNRDYLNLLFHDDLKCLKLSFLRPLLYFYQSISYITLSTGLTVYFEPLAKALSLDFLFITNTNSNSSNTDYISEFCLYDGLDGVTKQLLPLTFPAFMFIALPILSLIGYLMFKYCNLKFLKMGLKNIFSILWSLILIAQGVLLTKCFTLLACGNVSSIGTLHFYLGYLNCYDSIWWKAVIVFFCIILFWFFVWFILYKMDKINRSANISSMRTITKAYKPNYWFWEILLISRRILISLFITFDYVSSNYFNFILLIILIIYLSFQIQYKPFRWKRVNNIEHLCMFLLICALGCIMSDIQSKSKFNASIIMSIIILLPFLLFIIYCFISLYNFIELKYDNQLLNTSQKHFKRIQSLDERIHNFNSMQTAGAGASAHDDVGNGIFQPSHIPPDTDNGIDD